MFLVRSTPRRWLAMALMVALSSMVSAGSQRATAQHDARQPVSFPRDEAPHDGPVEWWYYTGHLFTPAGDRYGFEQVFFRGERGLLSGYAAHFAITDGPTRSFHYDQRIVQAAGVSRPTDGFDLTIDDWSMRGANGTDLLHASMPGYDVDLRLIATKPPALHDGDGYVDYGDGTRSYYYSRTRMSVSGTLIANGEPVQVTGEAWMDHQWGNFVTFNEGGWDWFSMQLDDGTDLMLYLINDRLGKPVIVDGTLVDQEGRSTSLEDDDFGVAATAYWTSGATGTTYPSAWTVTIPEEDLRLTLLPTIEDQELDTRNSTDVVYWEGEVTVAGSRAGRATAGLGYVELTGYDARPATARQGIPRAAWIEFPFDIRWPHATERRERYDS